MNEDRNVKESSMSKANSATEDGHSSRCPFKIPRSPGKREVHSTLGWLGVALGRHYYSLQGQFQEIVLVVKIN